MSDSPVPDGPPRTDADDRPVLDPPVDPVIDDVIDGSDEPLYEPIVHLDIERPDRAEDLRPVDLGDEEDWPHGEVADEPGVPDYDDLDEHDDPDAPGLGVLGIGDPAEPNEPA